MHRLIKYLKPFLGLIIVAIAFLFIQAMSDLALPGYMARIVNNGIQQGGVEDAVPEAIRESQMEKLTLFMQENEEKKVIEQYNLIKSSVTYEEHYVKKYPVLETENIYVLDKIDKTKRKELDSILKKALFALHGIERMDENLSAIEDSFITQVSVESVKAEYEALGMDVDQLQNRYIMKMGIIMLMISLISAVAIVIVGFLSSKTAAGLAKNLRQKVFTKVENFSKAELDNFSTATLITRTTNDITHIQMLVVMMIRMLIYAPILAMGGILKAVEHSLSMSWIIAIAVIVLLMLIIVIFSIALPKFKLIQKLIDRLNLVTRENLSGMMVIRAFNTEEFEEKRFDDANKELIKTNLFVNRLMVLMSPAMMLIMNGTILLIVWVGSHQIANSTMQVGDMMAFMQYAMQIIMSFLMLSMMFIMIPRASVSANRIVEVLETKAEIKDPQEPQEFKADLKNVVEFENVSFRYKGAEEDMLKNISFKALPGETTAFIGSTGSGKTTLVNLIPRFHDVTEGRILVDGVDIREVKQHDLREKIGYVPQKSSLFSGTIESNLKYAKEDASKEELLEAAEIAQVSDFITENTKGLKAEISQHGANVSGGQKQRLSIARALVKKPGIYIFDDTFSALDFKTDAALRKALKEKTISSTTLLVAQRVTSIMNADQIIVLEEGEIVCKGTHKNLIENCPTYQEIALSQISKEELR